MFEPGSPFAIQFTSFVENSSSMEPLNVSVHPCWDTSLSCSCGDCPSANSCADVIPPPSHDDNGFCKLQVGRAQVARFNPLMINIGLHRISYYCCLFYIQNLNLAFRT